MSCVTLAKEETEGPEKENPSQPPAETLLFEELFEDTNWEARGWYDGPQMQITAAEHLPNSGQACVWRWKKAGDISPEGRGARVRLKPVNSDQFLMAPYFGPGVPHEQSIWIDDLRIYTEDTLEEQENQP